MKSDLYQKASIRIGEIASGAEYRMDENFQNLPIFGAKFRFSNLKKSENFPNIIIPKVGKFSLLKNS